MSGLALGLPIGPSFRISKSPLTQRRRGPGIVFSPPRVLKMVIITCILGDLFYWRKREYKKHLHSDPAEARFLSALLDIPPPLFVARCEHGNPGNL